MNVSEANHPLDAAAPDAAAAASVVCHRPDPMHPLHRISISISIAPGRIIALFDPFTAMA